MICTVLDVLIEFITLEWLKLTDRQWACRLGSLEAIGWANTWEHFESGSEDSLDESLALFDFHELTEIPRELLSEVEVVFDILSVNVLVVDDVFKHEDVEYARITSNLLELIRSMLELYLRLPTRIVILCHEDIVDSDLIRVAITRLTDELAPARLQEEWSHQASVLVE